MKPRGNSALGELEGSVMAELWRRGALATPLVHESVGVPRGLAYTTVLTVLQRLHKKGLVTREESRKGHIYRAALTQEEFASRRGELLAESLVSLGTAGVAAFVAEAERLDPQVIATLRAQLEALE